MEIYVLLREEPETVLNFMGRIVHNAGGGFGIKIVQIDDQAQQGLNDFIKDLVDSGAEIVGYPQDPDESDDDGNKGG